MIVNIPINAPDGLVIPSGETSITVSAPGIRGYIVGMHVQIPDLGGATVTVNVLNFNGVAIYSKSGLTDNGIRWINPADEYPNGIPYNSPDAPTTPWGFSVVSSGAVTGDQTIGLSIEIDQRG